MLRKVLITIFVLTFTAAIAAAAFLSWGYYYITRDLPKLTTLDDYRPAAVSKVLSADGTLIGEFYKLRRYPVRLEEVPPLVRNAFLAAEDAQFYEHAGIDPVSIARALVKNITRGSARQGGSTITQQVVKNLLLTPEKNIERKIKEAILSYRLEKKLSKDEIFAIYLNEIFFGNGAYGIKAAATSYFRKPLADLTLGEASLLAGLPKAPSEYSPINHMEKAKRRQKYVLRQMLKAEFITQEQADQAEKEKVRAYPAPVQNYFRAPYYVAEVRRVLAEKWPHLNVDVEGLEIHTAVNLDADRLATAALRKGMREVDKRRGWRGPISTISEADSDAFRKKFASSIPAVPEVDTVYPALVLEVIPAKGAVRVDIGAGTGVINFKEASWARKRIDAEGKVSWIKPEDLVRKGDVIEVSLKSAGKDEVPLPPGQLGPMVLDQTPDLEGSVVLLDPYSGKVATVIGGYSYQRSVFNRATQAHRQPGSTFKPLIYLAAVDGFKYTPATIVYDSPRTFRVGDQYWTPGNFDGKFLGPITLRTALQRSRNLVSADIISRIGVDPVIKYAHMLGIQSKIGRYLSIALGSSEVTALELTRAYGVLAAKGLLFDSVFVTKIVDRVGTVLYDYDAEQVSQGRQVLDENSAFIMTNMMKGVIENGTGYKVKELGRPAAGKTGTSNDQMDAWFIGFTPQWVCGVWVGFDQKKPIGAKETGGMVSAPIWLYFMKDFLATQDAVNRERIIQEAKAQAEKLGIEYQEPEQTVALDFSVPDGVDPVWVNKYNGFLTDPGDPAGILEYFVKGTEPKRGAEVTETTTSYLESPDL